MNIGLTLPLEVKFKTKRAWDGPTIVEESVYLCFRHAVFAVVHHKKKIEVEVDVCCDECDVNTDCVECAKEYRREERLAEAEDDFVDPSEEPHNNPLNKKKGADDD